MIQDRSLQICGGVYMGILYENPDPMNNQQPPDDIGELLDEEDEEVPLSKSKRLTDILKQISSNRKSKNHDGGKTYGNKSQRTLRSGNRRRKRK
jgi:hypothetical protein